MNYYNIIIGVGTGRGRDTAGNKGPFTLTERISINKRLDKTRKKFQSRLKLCLSTEFWLKGFFKTEGLCGRNLQRFSKDNSKGVLADKAGNMHKSLKDRSARISCTIYCNMMLLENVFWQYPCFSEKEKSICLPHYTNVLGISSARLISAFAVLWDRLLFVYLKHGDSEPFLKSLVISRPKNSKMRLYCIVLWMS